MTGIETPTRVGDTLVVGGSRVGEPGRKGEILEILGSPEHPHYRIRWEDGHEALFYPAGNVVIRHPVARALVRTLAEHGSSYELIPHRPTATAKAEARALGVPPAEVAKTVVLTTAEGYVRAVLPASERLDLRKVRKVLDEDGSTRLATEVELAAAYPDFELGAVPPLGGPAGDRVVVDRRLATCEKLVFEAGTHHESVRLRTEDLLELADARLADLCAD